jgi:hypothetical protein
MSTALETANIAKTPHGFEITDSRGEIIANYETWEQVADSFRSQDFSEEYIAKRKADIDRGDSAQIDETDE